jgi:hypothetical protein
VFGAGEQSTTNTTTGTLQYINIATTGNSYLFGDLTRKTYPLTACGSSTRGLFGGGGSGAGENIIDYVTIASVGNAIDFGDLTQGRGALGSCSSETRGIFAGGTTTGSGAGSVNTIDYVTIAATGNATDFGDLIQPEFGALSLWGCSSPTRGVLQAEVYTPPHQTSFNT